MCNTIFTASCHWQLWLPWWCTAPSYSKYSRSCQAAQSKVKRSCSAQISPFDCHANEAVLTSTMRRGYHREEGSICYRFSIRTRQKGNEGKWERDKAPATTPFSTLLFSPLFYTSSCWEALFVLRERCFFTMAFFFFSNDACWSDYKTIRAPRIKLWEVTVRGRLAGQCVILTSTSALLLVIQHMTIPLLQRLPPTLFLFSCV